MGRREKTSGFEDMILVASKLPWWANLVLALLSYLILHGIASHPLTPVVATPGQMGDAVVKGLIRTAAVFGQLILPAAFIFGAVLSAITARRQRRIYDNVAAQPAAIHDLGWQDFERLLGEHFRRQGFQVTREGGNGPDGGIDLVLRLGREVHLVQCKHWKAYKVGVPLVREFYGVMAAKGAAGGYFITSGEYTDDAKMFANGLNLTLIDGRKLREIIGSVKAGVRESIPSIGVTSVCCPQCGSEMKKRVARSGSNAGSEFWGCVKYPKCHGTKAVVDEEDSRSAKVSVVATATVKACPDCGDELVARQIQSGPKAGQNILGCLTCKKAWPTAMATASARQPDFDIR